MFNIHLFQNELAAAANYVGFPMEVSQDQLVYMAKASAFEGLSERKAAIRIIQNLVKEAQASFEAAKQKQLREQRFEQSKAQVSAWFKQKQSEQEARFASGKSKAAKQFDSVQGGDPLPWVQQEADRLMQEQFRRNAELGMF